MGDHLKFLNHKIVFRKSILILLIFFLNACAEENINSDPVIDLIKQNTFILVPINIYASVITKAQADEFVNLNCSINHLPPSEILNCKALKSCEEGQCIREYENHGTAFLMNSGRSLFTAWHVVYPTHAAALLFISHYLMSETEQRRQELYSLLKPQFVLLDHNQNIVYDTRLNKTAYSWMGDPLSTIHAKNGHTKENVPFGYFENIPYDYVGIQLSKDIGDGLKQAGEKTRSNEEFFASGFGYDGIHFNFDISIGHQQSLYDLKTRTQNYLDFQLRPLNISLEDFTSMTPVEQLILMGYSEESAVAQIEEHGLEPVTQAIQTVLNTLPRHSRDSQIEQDKNVIFTDNKILPGQSGGPLTNVNGEVVGILTNSMLSRTSEGDYLSSGAGAYLLLPLEN